MNKSFIFIFLLIAGVSCSQPDDKGDIEPIYQSLTEQKHFYYNVEYSICNANGAVTNDFYGLVALNRNSDSGISSAYFGTNESQKEHYLHSIYLKDQWIYDLQSPSYRLEDADLITDSLHSPILLNPDQLWQIEQDSVSIANQKIDRKYEKWTFELRDKPDQLIVFWNSEINKITEIEYKYAVKSPNTYSKKWSFDYMAKSEFTRLEKGFKQQNQAANQAFL